MGILQYTYVQKKEMIVTGTKTLAIWLSSAFSESKITPKIFTITDRDIEFQRNRAVRDKNFEFVLQYILLLLIYDDCLAD